VGHPLHFSTQPSLEFHLLFGVTGEPPAGHQTAVGEESAHAVLRLPFGGKDVHLVARFLQDVKAMDLYLAVRIAEWGKAKTDSHIFDPVKDDSESGCRPHDPEDRMAAKAGS